jgi:hypothetical protein
MGSQVTVTVLAYSVRYAASDFGGADMTCSGSFRNTQLWAEVDVPS